MTGAELTAAESKRRAAIAALAAADDARLRWRHLLLLGVALTAMTLCGLGVAGSVWTPAARLLGSSSSRLRGLVPILLAAYLLAAPVAACAWARFDPRRAATRLPLVLGFGAVGIVALLVILWVQAGGAGSYASGLPHDFAAAELKAAVREHSPPNWPLVLQVPSAKPTTLAAALVDRDEATAVLGAPIGPPEVPRRFLMRNASLCRYRTLDRAATLTIVVRKLSGEVPRGLLERGEPVSGLGDRAAAWDDRICVVAGGWILIMSLHRRDRRALARQPLIDGARRAVTLLPALDGASRPAS